MLQVRGFDKCLVHSPKIPVSDLANGVYTIKINADGQVFTKKFTKSK